MQFSIVAISYNQPRHIEALCESLLLMNFDPAEYEVILVDDGSNIPVSRLIAIPPNLNIHFIYLPREEGSCRAKARNAGASVAKGEYLVFIDGDCLVGINFLANYHQYFLNNSNNSIVLGSFYCIDFHKKPKDLTSTYMYSLEKEDPYHRDDFRFYLEKINNARISDIHAPWLLLISRNFAIKNALFKLLNGFDERFIGWGSEDTEFAYRVFKAGHRFDLIVNKVFHLSESADTLGKENKYKSWIENIGLFYSIHKDPIILLLITQEKLIFDVFFSRKGWDHQFQIKSFQALKPRMDLLTENK